MSDSIYKSAKEAFIDRIEPDKFVRLDSNISKLERLLSLLQTPMKMVILYGEPGIGKTALLHKVLYDLKNEKNIVALFQPPFTLEEFKQKLSLALFQKETDPLNALQNLKDVKTVILDEAQLFSSDILEYIRILSDTQKVRFVLAMHQNSNEEIMAKKHFETRIAQSIKLEAPSKQELLVYIQKILFANNLIELAHAFNLKNSTIIYNFTNGNLRKTNKFLFTLFDILEYFEQTRPSLLNGQLIDKKFIEMSAIALGYIDA